MRTSPSLYHDPMTSLYGRVNDTAARLYAAGQHDRARRYLGRADLVLKREQARRGERIDAYVSSDGRRLQTWPGGVLGSLTVTGRARTPSGTLLTCYAVTLGGRRYFGRGEGPGMILKLRPAVSANKRGERL